MTDLLPDVDVKTVLDVVERNFRRFDMKTYACRMIYIGEHTLSKEELMNLFRTTVHIVNGMYCDIPVAGLLLMYDSYFIHIVEGSEDTIYRHLRFLMRRAEELEKAQATQYEGSTEGLASVNIVAEPLEPEKKVFKGLKMLVTYHSIRKLQLSSWRALYARPPALVTRPDPRGPLAQHMEQLRIFLNKIWKLIGLAVADKDLSFENLGTHDPKIEALPEVALLDFLLQSVHLYDLQRCMQMHRRVEDYVFYFESVWPLQTHNTPLHLYTLKTDDSFVDSLPVMPWELVKPEKAEGEEQDQSGSSSD